MKYWDYIQIREGKPAYNIEMEEQGNWESFLPNQQFNEILLKAIGAVRNNDMDKHRSLWIEGTYGTGKSHAGAVLKLLLRDNVEEIRQWVDEEYRDPQYDILRKQIYSLRERKSLVVKVARQKTIMKTNK
jgi:chromosomal replication initiation ATPase DnaA